MDVKRIFVYSGLFFISMVLWSTWQKEHLTASTVSAPSVVQTRSESETANASAATTGTAPTASALAAHQTISKDRIVELKSDVLDLKVDTLGGKLVSAKLLDYASELHKKDSPFVLLNHDPDSLYIADSGFADGDAQKAKPIQYHTTTSSVVLSNGEKQASLTLTGTSEDGALVTKTITLKPGDYAVGVNYQIKNPTNKALTGHIYSEIIRKKPEGSNGGMLNTRSYTGASISDPDNKLFEKVSFKQMREENFNRKVDGGWIAMQQHYFLTAWIPAQSQKNTLYSHVYDNDIYTIGLMGPKLDVPAGGAVDVKSNLYVGPEITSKLKELAPGLNLTIDYGIFWFISAPLFWLLKHIYLVVGNWGLAIILVTVFIKLAFYRLSASSYRSMANMRRLQPKIESLKARYGDDKQKLSQATIELYKKEKVNPLGGCLPILIQIPVFIALYWVLLESVELRHAPFMLWIHDLSARDPYFVLPIIMGITMLVQQKLNPPPPDPMQAKLMMALPVLFTVIFLQFPAGLVLYWVVNNTLSILQQWYITQKFEAATASKK